MLYRVLLFIHVSAVIAWVGSGFLFQIFTERATTTGDIAKLKTVVEEGERLGTTLFGPTSVIVLATGLWLVFEGGWGFDHVFVIGGLVGVAASITLGAAVIGPTTKRLEGEFASSTTMRPEMWGPLARLRNAGRVDLAIMAVVVFLMKVKPGL